jgi:hypothetical protein
MSFFSSFFNIDPNEHPTLEEIQDDRLYQRRQVMHALGLGAMAFKRLLRTRRLRPARNLGRYYFRGATVKACARHLSGGGGAP